MIFDGSHFAVHQPVENLPKQEMILHTNSVNELPGSVLLVWRFRGNKLPLYFVKLASLPLLEDEDHKLG